jgi:DSF synthase
MDMHVHQALLHVAERRAPDRPSAHPLEFFFSEQLCAQFDAPTRALWVRWTPSPRPSFNPGLLRALSHCAKFLSDSGGRIEYSGQPTALEYTVLSSAVPGVFNLGGDLDLFMRLIESRDRGALVEYGKACVHVLFRNYVAHGLPLTTVSLVQGDCLGGGFEAALSSDIVVAERHARFGFPEIMFNLFPGMGAYSFLDRRVGRKVTEELLSTGKTYCADDMLHLGVIDQVVDTGSGEVEVAALIRRLSRSRNGRQGLASARRRVDRVTYDELLDVVHLWADCALRLTGRDLKLMQRLVSRQTELHAPSQLH